MRAKLFRLTRREGRSITDPFEAIRGAIVFEDGTRVDLVYSRILEDGTVRAVDYVVLDGARYESASVARLKTNASSLLAAGLLAALLSAMSIGRIHCRKA